jgi:hypothetical protein
MRLDQIEKLGKDFAAQHKEFIRNIDTDLYKQDERERHNSNYKKENPIYLVKQ